MTSSWRTNAASVDTLDLADHLALVSHVVHEVSLRLGSNVDRAAMFNHGALGLVVAARRHEPEAVEFGTQALQAIRASVIGSLRSTTAPPSDADLASLLSVPLSALQDARATAVVAPHDQQQQVPATSAVGRLARAQPAFLSA